MMGNKTQIWVSLPRVSHPNTLVTKLFKAKF